jgi:Tol biopolymer transport system component
VRAIRPADGRILPFVVDLTESGQIGRSRWLPSGKAIAFVGRDAAGRTGVFSQDFSRDATDTTATRRPIAAFDSALPTESFGVSPDGRRIVGSEVDPGGGIPIIDGIRRV